MEPLHAVVKNGRLTLDAPTDRPDGDVVMLISVDDLLGAADGPGLITLEMPSRKRNSVDAAALIRELRAL
jgi:hypothetical protein